MRLLRVGFVGPLDVGSRPLATTDRAAALRGESSPRRCPTRRADDLMAFDLPDRRPTFGWRRGRAGAEAAPRRSDASRSLRPFPEVHREGVPVGRRASLATLTTHTHESQAQREQTRSRTYRRRGLRFVPVGVHPAERRRPEPRINTGDSRWSQPGSNRRPPACKAGVDVLEPIDTGTLHRQKWRYYWRK